MSEQEPLLFIFRVSKTGVEVKRNALAPTIAGEGAAWGALAGAMKNHTLQLIESLHGTEKEEFVRAFDWAANAIKTVGDA